MTSLKRTFMYALFLCLLLPAYGFDKRYKSEAQIPEPLIFDLVRRIDSDKGELEVNSLFIQEDASEVKGVYAAPEIEYAFSEGKAIEVELPTVNGKVKTVKGALQFRLPGFLGDVTGTQLIHEKVIGDSIHETTVLLLSGKKLTQKWSAFTMIGNRFVYGNDPSIKNSRWRELPIVNLNFFYDYAEVFDVGLETNLRGIGAGFEELIIMPQVHALMAKDFKLQAGFGLSYDGYSFSPISAFRLIKEFNYEN